MSLKLDMRKAYDHVKWDYLEHTLSILGFPNCFTNLIMFCVRLGSFSVLKDGMPKAQWCLSEDLDRWILFFPYIFLLCTEGFVTMLR